MIAATLTLVCTLWLAFSTQDLRDFAAEQAHDTKTQLELTRAAVQAADKQAEGAKEVNQLSKIVSDRQTRPYIVVDDHDFSQVLAQPGFADVTLKNVGATPVYGMFERLAFGFPKTPRQDDAPYPDFVGFDAIPEKVALLHRLVPNPPCASMSARRRK